jgi:hypothetical protein
MTREALSALEGLQRVLALRNGSIVNLIRLVRMHPRESCRGAVMALITVMADNNSGTCRLSVKRMAQIFAREERNIHAAIGVLEADGLIGVSRINGLANCYWPLIPSALATIGASVTWFADALSYRPRARITPDVDVRGGPLMPNAATPDVEQHSISLNDIHSPPAGVECIGNHSGPHLSRAGFVISKEHELIIPMETIECWQRRFPAIPDLEAQMQKLASVILRRGTMHPGWNCPGAWMAGCLAEDNQKAADAARLANAKVAQAQRGQPARTFRQ